MTRFALVFDRVDAAVSGWMARHGMLLLRVSLGIVFLWFGLLKLLPAASPAESLATKTFHELTFGVFSPRGGLVFLAVWEALIGVGLLFRLYLRATLFLLWLQMLGTLTPLFLYPRECFTFIPFMPTLVGQYIIKNLVLISAGIVIGGSVRPARPPTLFAEAPARRGL